MGNEVAKIAILAEMLTLYAGSVINAYDVGSNNNVNPSTLLGPVGTIPVDLVSAVLSKQAMEKAIAVGALLVILTMAADMGFGTPAAVFGGVVVVGYLMSPAGRGAASKLLLLQSIITPSSPAGSVGGGPNVAA